MFRLLLNPANYYFNPFAYPVICVGVLNLLIGLFVLWQNKKAVLNIAFFFFCFSVSIWLTSISFVYSSRISEVALIWYRYFTFFGVVNILPSLIFLGIVYMRELKTKKTIVYFNYIFALIFYILAITTDKIFSSTDVRKYFWGFYPIYASGAVVYILFFVSQFIFGFGKLCRAYKTETAPTRKSELKIMAIAALIAFTATADFIPKFFPVSLYPYGYISMLTFISLIGYSIVRYKAFNIETVIHKTLMWLVASSIVFIPVVLFSYWLHPWYKGATPFKVAILCGALFLFLTIYLRLIQPKIDHFFQRRKYDLERASEKFVLDLVHLKSPSELIDKIQETIKDTLYSERVDICLSDDTLKKEVAISEVFLNWICKNDDLIYRDFIDIDPKYESIKDYTKDYFQKTDSIVTIPLVMDEKLLGLINLSRKFNLKRYSAYDFQFLKRLKNGATIALSNSLLYGRVEEEVQLRTEELIQTQQQLIQSEKLATVGTLAGGVAHEINNPLAAVLINAQMLLMEAKTEDEKESLKLIEQAAKRCREIVQKLMLYSRKPLGSREIKEVNLETALNNVLSFLEYQLNQENIEITRNPQNPPFIVNGSQSEMEQVLTNLILNAKDAIKQDKKSGNINIGMTRQGNNIIIKVKDDGIGILKEHIPKIFDPFFTTKDVGKGTGLGLSICQSIVEQHNGTITVESQEEKGTTFTIQLPTILNYANSI